jgi:flagellar motor switch protein FliM
MAQQQGDHFQVSVGGAVGGNVVVGRQNQIISSPTTNGVSPADLAAFRSAVDDVKAQVASQAPEQAEEASAKLEELHQAATAAKPDLNTFERVHSWFASHLPTFAGAVTGLLVHPVVGALVKSAGDAVVDEFHRRFGAPGA